MFFCQSIYIYDFSAAFVKLPDFRNGFTLSNYRYIERRISVVT